MSRLMLSRRLATLVAVPDLVDVRVGSRDRMRRTMRRADPFQEIGIPCWSGVAGPLSDPNESEPPYSEND